MTQPKWVTLQLVEFIHEGVIEVGGGSHGLRDAALLESALSRPQNQHAYGETDTFQLAASYAGGISRNHAFVDGNKRTAFYHFMWPVIFWSRTAMSCKRPKILSMRK